MHHKNIKLAVRRQLEKQFPKWKRLPRKVKKELASKVLEEVVAGYDFKQEIDASVPELLTIGTQLPVKGILSLDKMADFIDMLNNNRIIKFSDINS